MHNACMERNYTTASIFFVFSSIVYAILFLMFPISAPSVKADADPLAFQVAPIYPR